MPHQTVCHFIGGSSARNGVTAEQQVASDALLLLESEDRLTLKYPFNITANTGQNAPLDLITSYFDHEYPTYSSFPNNQGTADGNITLYWGERRGAGTSSNCDNSTNSNSYCYDGHDGYDFAVGSNIFAAADGVVSYVGCYDEDQNPPSGNPPCSENQSAADGLGLMVSISHDHGYETRYGHLASVSITQGITITQDYTIGVAGNSGNAEGIHLHFSVLRNGLTDPYGWIPGEVTIDPLTQPVTDTQTGNIFLGVPSYCLWEEGCPNSKWVDPNNGTELTIGENITLTVPPGATLGPAQFTIAPMLDTMAQASEVPAGYSFTIRAWDTQGNPITSFGVPLSLAIHYDEFTTDIVSEETLTLFVWDPISSTWQPLPTTLDMTNNLAFVSLANLSTFSLRGEPLLLAPSITSISPNNVPNNASSQIIIVGSNFRADSRVWLANSLLDSTYSNPNTIIAEIPAWLSVGTYSIQVVNPDYQEDELIDALEVFALFTNYLPATLK